MRSNIVLKWAMSAVVILLLVIVSYYLYARFNDPVAMDDHMNNQVKHTTSHDIQEHHAHEENRDEGSIKSEVIPTVHYEKNEIHIELKDKEGNAVDQLEVTHEKIMHLIIVSDDLKQYYHLHPEKKGSGTFTVKYPLKEGSYKAFIDIKPKNKNYVVEPIPIEIGSVKHHAGHEALKPDTEYQKTVNGITVTMNPKVFKAGKEIVLKFDLMNKKPETYLGALGHVVILDESGTKYVHVHPTSTTDTQFATEFSKPGIYKIWAEFKINGKVNTFPFVVEVK